jgi:hypothetical protein
MAGAKGDERSRILEWDSVWRIGTYGVLSYQVAIESSLVGCRLATVLTKVRLTAAAAAAAVAAAVAVAAAAVETATVAMRLH